MKLVKIVSIFAFWAIVTTVTVAQTTTLNTKKLESIAFFRSKYSKEKVWSAQCSPANPVVGQDWSVFGLKAALDISNTPIEWGNNRYLKFVPEIDNSLTTKSLTDDTNKRNIKYNVSLKLFESDGTLVKVISKWGSVTGIGDRSFMYEAEGKTSIFFTMFNQKPSITFIYKPLLARASKISQLPFIVTGSCIGTTKWYNAARGYGFITLENGSEVIIAARDLAASGMTSLVEGQIVELSLAEGPRGFVAYGVHQP